MQDKLYRRSTIILGIIVIINIIAIIWLMLNRALWVNHGFTVIFGYAVAILLLLFIFSYYDLNQDRIIIKKMIKNGDIALAKIKRGTFYRIVKDTKFKNKVLWKLEIMLHDQDMNTINTEIIEKFSPTQTSIPMGNCFVIYNPNKPKDILIVPNIIISSIQEFAPLVEEYEKKFKPTYLNVYYNNGLVIKTYEESLKENKKKD